MKKINLFGYQISVSKKEDKGGIVPYEWRFNAGDMAYVPIYSNEPFCWYDIIGFKKVMVMARHTEFNCYVMYVDCDDKIITELPMRLAEEAYLHTDDMVMERLERNCKIKESEKKKEIATKEIQTIMIPGI